MRLVRVGGDLDSVLTSLWKKKLFSVGSILLHYLMRIIR